MVENKGMGNEGAKMKMKKVLHRKKLSTFNNYAEICYKAATESVQNLCQIQLLLENLSFTYTLSVKWQ